jgi:hypothetical protein
MPQCKNFEYHLQRTFSAQENFAEQCENLEGVPGVFPLIFGVDVVHLGRSFEKGSYGFQWGQI